MRLLALLAAIAAVASGQTGPEILNKSAETYRSLKSYHFEAQVLTETVSDNNDSRSRSTKIFAAVPPDRRRVESKGGQLASLRVYDGQHVWEFRPGVNQFARQNQDTYKPPMMNTLSDPVDGYKGLDKSQDAKLLRDENLEAAGGTRMCWVIEVPKKFRPAGMMLEWSPSTYWVDKATNLVLKEQYYVKTKPPNIDSVQTQTTTTTYTIARINGDVAAGLFQFQPPDGATEVAEFGSPFGGGSLLAGKPVPEFTLRDLDGKEAAVTMKQGKPRLLYFWATWCVPCRAQMPKIQELQDEFTEKGLLVMAINYGETEEIARKYVAEHKYSMRVLLDRDKTVAGKFTVSSIPVVLLIDGAGIIRAHYTGYNSALDLRLEMKKIGL